MTRVYDIEEPTFRRMVIFQKGYNYLHEKGPKSRGQHGMEITFCLQGPTLAVSVTISTGWVPLGPVDEPITGQNNYHSEPVHCDVWENSSVPVISDKKFGYVRPPSGMAVTFCAAAPTEYAPESHDCQLLGRPAYMSVSYSGSDPLLYELVNNGPAALWRALCKEYRDYLKEESNV